MLNVNGSRYFGAAMAAASPFASLADALLAARRIWLDEVDVNGWLEAFAAHPAIGTTSPSASKEMDQSLVGVSGNNGHATWIPAWSSFMLSYLANLVVNGTKTSSTYKMVHYNACAKALQEKYGIVRTGEQIKNHLKTKQKKFRRICELRVLSAAGWDEDTYTITLNAEHYNNHIKDHKADVKFLNKPLENFVEMHTVFGSTMATGLFAKDSSAPLGTEDGGAEDEETEETRNDGAVGSTMGTDTNGETSSASRPSKIGKTNNTKKTNKRPRAEIDPLVAAITRGSNKLAKAIKEVGKSDNDVLADLYDNLMALEGSFNETHLSFYHAYLVENPSIARAFNQLKYEHKINWVARHIAKYYPGQ